MTDADDVTNTDTWDMPVPFKPSEYASGGLWIMMKKLGEPTLPILEKGFLGLDLREGTTIEEAGEIVDILNRKATLITYTSPKHPEWVDNPGRGDRAKLTKH